MTTTNRPTRAEVNCETNEITIVEFTDEEIAQLEKDIADHALMAAQEELEAQAKADAKASAIAKLTALGLSEEEATALAG